MKNQHSNLAGIQASRWYARLACNDIDGTTDAAFRRWLETSAEHELEFERRELAWEFCGDLAGDPEIAAALEDLERRLESQQHRRGAARAYSGAFAAALAASLALVAVITWHMIDFGSTSYRTEIGEQRRATLADGSRVILNTNSQIRVDFDREQRKLHLERGEATVDVVKDPARPFVVHTRFGTATAVGTRYNVLDTGSTVEVAVLEGRVQVGARAGQILSAGQAVTVGQDGAASPMRVADLRRISAWHAERLEFDGMTLARAVTETNRYTRTKLRITDPSIADIEISGVFRAGDVAGFVAALNAAFGIRAVGGESEILLMPPLKAARGHAGLQPMEQP